MDDTQKTTGAITPSTKFIEFVGGKGQINFISNQATIEGKYLSGLDMGDITFKLTIYEDGTVDFDEVDTTKTTQKERERLLNVILDKTLTPYRNRTVVNELTFTSVEKVKDKNVPLYLSVEYVTPIEKLSSLFDDETIEVSDDAMDNLNDLLNSWFEDEEFAKEVQEIIDEENSEVVEDIDDRFMEHHDTNINSLVKDSFDKMKEEKLNELKSKKSQTEKEIDKIGIQISSLEKSLQDTQNDLKLLEDRIDDIQPVDDPNGYYFFVSERCNETVELDPDMDKLIRGKVSKIKQINVEGFMKLFTNGEYHISLSKIAEDGFESVDNFNELPENILEKLSSINLVLEDKKLVYNGEMGWGEIVNKMVKMGFEQNPEFDKFCGSNSYASKEETKSDLKNKETQF